MQEQLKRILIEVRSAWRFRWPALGAAWLICLAGWAGVSAMPDVYEARTRVFVNTTSQLRQILGEQIVEPNLDTELNFVRESLTGRVTLERVALQTGLATGAESAYEFDAIINRMQRQMQVAIGDAWGTAGNNFYTLSYKDPDRDLALSVVEALRSRFVEGTLGNRQEGSDIARGFFEEQVAESAAALSEAEDKLAQFKREHVDVLPGNDGGYFAMLQSQRAQLEDDKAELARLESVRDRMNEQLRGERQAVGARVGGALVETPRQARLRELTNQRDELLLNYTVEYQPVRALAESIERLREEIEAEGLALEESGTDSAAAPDSLVYQEIQIALYETEADIESLSVEVRRGEQEIARLRSLMEEVPEVEAELAELTRAVQSAEARYNSALNALETERLTREASETDQVDFRLIDPPTASQEPVEPRRPLLLLGVLGAGFGGGGVFAFLLSQTRPIFSNPLVLRQFTGLPVLGAVSMTWKDQNKSRRRLSLLSLSLGALALIVVFAVIYLVEIMGPGLRSFIA